MSNGDWPIERATKKKKKKVDDPKAAPLIAMSSTGNFEWYTPPEVADLARDVMGGIDLDPASCEYANGLIKAKRFYTKQDNGLQLPWKGRIWMNPPFAYSLIMKFSDRLVGEYRRGGVKQAVVLVPNATQRVWFQRLASYCTGVCFPRKRMSFHTDQGVPNGGSLKGQCLFYLGDRHQRFVDVFQQLGSSRSILR